MANLQIKGIDNELYEALKEIAAEEHRSVSQQTLLLLKDYLAKRHRVRILKTPAQALLDLSGSWEEHQDAAAIIAKIKRARKNSRKLKEGF